MIGVKIIEVNTYDEYEDVFNICEICKGTDNCRYQTIVIEFHDGKTDSFDGFTLDFGFYKEINIDNYLNFSDWLSKYDFNEEEYYSGKYGYFEKLLDLYYEEKEND